MLREILAKFGVEVDVRDLVSFDKKLEEVKGSLASFGMAAAPLALAGLFTFTQGLIKQGEEINKWASRLSLSAEEMQQWQYMAAKTGASAIDLALGIKFLYRNMAVAAEGGAAAKNFARLGISVRDSNGKVKTAVEVMGDLADAVGKAETDAEKTGIALHFLGKGGVSLLPLLKGGRAEVERLTKRFAELGGGLSQDFVDAAHQAKGAQIDLAYSTLLLKNHIGVQLIPIVTWATLKLSDMSLALGKAVRNTNTARTVFGLLGTASAVTGVKLGLHLASKLGLVSKIAEGTSRGLFGTIGAIGQLGKSLLRIGLPLVLIFLLLEDLYTMFNGGKSVIGAFIDGMFGVGASAALVALCKDAFKGLLALIPQIIPYLQAAAHHTALFLKDLFHGFKGYGDMFSEFFMFLGEDIAHWWNKMIDDSAAGLINLGHKFDQFVADHPTFFKVLNGVLAGFGGVINPAGSIISNGAGSLTGGGGGNNVQQTNETTINVNGATDAATTAGKVLNGLGAAINPLGAAIGAIIRPG